MHYTCRPEFVSDLLPAADGLFLGSDTRRWSLKADDITIFPDNFLQIGKDSDGMLPTAASDYRGKVIRVEGGVGVADKTYQCLKGVGIDHTEDRYFRSDSWAVNGLNTYRLGSTNSSSVAEFGIVADVADTYRMGIRVWKRAANGDETEISPGVIVAMISRSVEGEGWQNASWVPPETSLEATDAIVVRMYGKRDGNPTWEQFGEWISEQLIASKLLQVTWVVYYYTVLDWTFNQSWTCKTGDSTYSSRIYNFQWKGTDPFAWIQVASG